MGGTTVRIAADDEFIASYEPGDDLVRSDPYLFYTRLRELGGVVWAPHLSAWIVASHSAASDALRDGRFVVHAKATGSDPTAAQKQHIPVLMFMEPPEHTRVRRLVMRSFTSQRLTELRPRVVAITRRILDELPRNEPLDVVAAFGLPLPISVISELIGIPEEQRGACQRLAARLSGALDWSPSTASLETATQATLALVPRFLRLLRDKQRNPSQDVISDLLSAESDDAMSRAEIISTCVMLFVAGHLTTSGLIGNGLVALLRNPDQLELLRNSPELIPNAIKELLRYDSPVHMLPRIASEDVLLNNETIRAGDTLLILLASANRDENVFASAEALDIERADIQHMAFGRGIHICVGSALAQMEAEVAFEALLERYPKWALCDSDLEWQPSKVQRSLARLMVEFRA